MRLHYLLLVIMVALLSSTNALSATTVASQTKFSIDGATTRRLLRTARTFVVSDKEEVLADSEERGGGFSSLTSKISAKIPIDVKLAWWQHITGKSSESVKKKLGLAGLEGVELTTHKNYPRLEKYMDTKEKNKLWKLADQYYSTYKMWNDVKLPAQQGRTFEEVLAQLKAIRTTHKEEFRIYKRYAILLDDIIISRFGSGYNRPTKFLDKDATPVEILARAHFWAGKERDPAYVREFLGLLHASKPTLDGNPYYQYYLQVLAQVKEAKAKAKAT